MRAKFINEHYRTLRNLEDFKERYKDFIDKGIIQISHYADADMVVIDRFDGKDFLCDAKDLGAPRADILKLGFVYSGPIGTYTKKKEEPKQINKEEIRTSKQMTDYVQTLIEQNDVNGLKEFLDSDPKYSVNINFLLDAILNDDTPEEIKRLLASKYQDKLKKCYIEYYKETADENFKELYNKIKPYFKKSEPQILKERLKRIFNAQKECSVKELRGWIIEILDDDQTIVDEKFRLDYKKRAEKMTTRDQILKFIGKIIYY